MQDRCRVCQNAKTTAYNQTPEGKLKHRAYNRLHMRRNRAYYESKDSTLHERTRAWQGRNPEKKAAHDKVYYALKSGRLTKEVCEVCGSVDTQAHHDDYTKPLDVRWLCSTHHAEHHVGDR